MKSNYKKEISKEKKQLRAKLLFELTGEIINLHGLRHEMFVRDAKNIVEIDAGIPSNLQRLYYLDEADMLNSRPLKSYNVVNGATFRLDIWHSYQALVQAVISGNTAQVLDLGTTPDSNYQSPNTEYMTSKSRAEWLRERGFVALYVAAHRGQTDICSKLLDSGVPVSDVTPSLRTALHVAAATGHADIIHLLMEKGADINVMDESGLSPLHMAERYGHKSCGRQMIKFMWEKRAKQSGSKMDRPTFAHQRFDSALKVHLSGSQAQMYVQQLLPATEYEGTGISAPKSQTKQLLECRQQSIGDPMKKVESLKSLSDKAVAYDEWMKRKNIAKKMEREKILLKENLERLQREQEEQRIVKDDEPTEDVAVPVKSTSTLGLIESVIYRKMKEQQEQHLPGLPYDLWLDIPEHSELFHAVQSRGLNKIIQY